MNHLKNPFAGRRPRYADVASTAALVLALGTGGAYAAAQIGTKDIRNNAVTSAKIKNNTVKKADLAAPVKAALGRTGAVGPAGPAGPTGAAGPQGVSAWETIPSGTTVTGRYYDTGTFTSANTQQVETINLPAHAPTELTHGGVNFAADASSVTTDDDATCTGTYEMPTAPPGKVCVYPGSLSGVTSAQVWTFAANQHRKDVFYLALSGAANTAWTVWGSWAYTAA